MATSDLNSVLIEGVVEGTPEYLWNDERDDGAGDSAAAFTVRCRRPEGIYDWFPVVATGKVAGRCMEFLHHGRGVRIVGRLRWLDWSQKIDVLAKHVEFKPAPKQQNAPA